MIKKILRYLLYKVKYPKDVIIGYNTVIGKKSKFEGLCQIHPNSVFDGYMGLGSYVGPRCNLSAYIGRFTSVASSVTCTIGKHPYAEPFVSSSPVFYSLNPQKSQSGFTFARKQMVSEKNFFDESNKIAVKIGNDVWIGQDVLLIGGVSIGDGAVVLAKAVVTHDVPPYAIVGGVPAKVIKYRYDDNTIKWLLGVKWWNHDIEWFKRNWELMCDMSKFKEYVKNRNL